MKRLSILLLAAVGGLLLPACTKTVDFDFRSVDPIPVVEAYYMPDASGAGSCFVRATRTLPYDAAPADPVPAGTFSCRLVDLTAAETLLECEADGILDRTVPRPADGHEYLLEVRIGDALFSAQSLYHDPVAIEDARFEYKSVMGTDKLICAVSFRDRPGEENYYYCTIRTDTWSLSTPCSDKYSDGRLLTVEFSCDSSTGQMGTTVEGADLRPGDVVQIELRTIDRAVWDFYRTEEQGSAFTPADPAGNFSGGCLGYFSACSGDERQIVYLP